MSDKVSLKRYNSFHLEAGARGLRELTDPAQLVSMPFDRKRDLVLGGGSNLLLADDIPGNVLLVRLAGRALANLDRAHTLVRLGAGENWHEAVRWTLSQGLSGLENLSLIPGLCGAAPLQNIGAYGVELSEVLHRVEVWDWQKQTICHFDRAACDFAYRDSVFKSGEPDRYLVLAIELKLSKVFTPRLAYAGIRTALETRGIKNPTALQVSDAVIALRRQKLPDPAVIGNAGSFFKNPLLGTAEADRLRRTFPDLPLYADGESGFKSSAAWMIEQCGWKGHRDGDAGVSAQHALVLVNHGTASGRELLALARQVRDSVLKRFGVALENEPRIVPEGESRALA